MAKFRVEDESKKDNTPKPAKDFDGVVHDETVVKTNVDNNPKREVGKREFKEIRHHRFFILRGGVKVSDVVRSVAVEYDGKKNDASIKESDYAAEVATLKAQVEAEYKK